MNERIESIVTAMNFIADNFMTAFRTDINHDKTFMLEEKPIEFIWIMRDWGTHVINPQWEEKYYSEMLSYFSPTENPNSNWPKECRFFGVYLQKKENRIVEFSSHSDMKNEFHKMLERVKKTPDYAKKVIKDIIYND
jgi:hypothetical protein